MYKFISNSPEETEDLGQAIGHELSSGDVVCLSGELGAGKTAFVKGIAKGLGIDDYVTSPTFTIVNEYKGKHMLYHFDVYRVNDVDELDEIGFEEYIYSDAVSVIEWADLIPSALPNDKVWIEIRAAGRSENGREIIIKSCGKKYKKLVEQLSLHKENKK